MGTRVHVDGVNPYSGALKRTPFRWLDPVKPTNRPPASPRVRDRPAPLLHGACFREARSAGAGSPAALLQALVTLPEGEHRVLGGAATDTAGGRLSRQTRGTRERRSRDEDTHPGRRNRGVPHHGGEGLGRQSCGPPAERRVEGSVRCGSGRVERHGHGGPDPNGHRGSETSGLPRLSGPVADRITVAERREPRTPHPSRDAVGGAS